MSKESNNMGGLFTSLLATLFIGLKLTGHIAWSWFWVLSPIWIPICLIIIFLAGAFVWYSIKYYLVKRRTK